MRIAVLSDLHIGARARACALGHEHDDFQSFLDELEREHDAVVLNGDVWQSDHGWGGPSPAELRLAQERSPWLLERLSQPAYHYVTGNHDALAEGPDHLLLGEGRVLVTHGHQFDPVIGTAPGVSGGATWLMGRLRWAGLRGVAAWGEGRDVAIKADRFEGPMGPYVTLAAARMREVGARVVVIGHTHIGSVCPVDGGTFANSGTCSGGRLSWVSIDSESGRAELHQH